MSGSFLSDIIYETSTMLKINAVSIMKGFEERIKLDSMNDINVFAPIKKKNYFWFKNVNVKTKIRKNGKQKKVACQRELLGILLCTSYKKACGY